MFSARPRSGKYSKTDADGRAFKACTSEPASRGQITATPLNATLDQLRGLPETLVIVAENDVLRDEGETYARLLAEAGVPRHINPVQWHDP